jgi:anthranilate phosphoribosyltransferase
MNEAFRELLRKVGSRTHTGKNLTRAEAEAATAMMLQQEASPAQIGAFTIAHRIKRPTAEELTGMLDAYMELGPQLKAIPSAHLPYIFGIPYDGRSRTAPVSPLTSLILIAANCPVILHGGRRMPTKYGLPLVEIWQALGVDWTGLSLSQAQQVFASTGLGFVYLPQHFPLADGLVPYRDEIGKRPPLATLELMWVPYRGAAHIVSGYVHPPTEERIRLALAQYGDYEHITVKGLEGSCDLPRNRTAIVGISAAGQAESVERLLLHPRDFGMSGSEVPLGSTVELAQAIARVLQGEASDLQQAAIWNGGFYLWQAGLSPTLEAGVNDAKTALADCLALAALDRVRAAIRVATNSDALLAIGQ